MIVPVFRLTFFAAIVIIQATSTRTFALSLRSAHGTLVQSLLIKASEIIESLHVQFCKIAEHFLEVC